MAGERQQASVQSALGLPRLRLFTETHLPLTVRPRPGWVNSKRTVAAVSNVWVKVLPTGARRRPICASCFLAEMRNFGLVWLAPEI